MYIVHNVPGRLRIKLEKMKNHPARLNQVKQWLAVDGVRRVTPNALTGSVVVEYDEKRLSSVDFVEILNRNSCSIGPRQKTGVKFEKAHEEIAVKVAKATFSWITGKVLEANGLWYIAALI